MKHKKIFLYIGAAALVTMGSCTKKFDSINTDPTKANASQFDPNLLLSSQQIEYFNGTTGYSGALLLQSMWAQILASASYPSYYSNGDKYVASGNLTSYDASLWNHCYNSAGYAYECQTLVKGNSSLSNLSGISLIMELLDIQNVTDAYGDCPFSQALQAKSGVNLPVYDAQQAIYTSLLAKLDSVIPTLDANKAIPTNDLFPYKGNIAQWKKFGYSLMLRMAMRLTKADAATAQKYAEKAYAGGTFAGTADDAWVKFDHNDGYNNNNTSAYQVAEDFSEIKWGANVITALKLTSDPRLSVIAEVPQAGAKNAANESLAGDNTAANQVGMPNGYDQNGGATDISNAPSYPGGSGSGSDFYKVGKYSRPAIGEYIALNTPAFAINYAETELLLAEAAARGWNVGASASVHYANGLTAALQSYATLSSSYGTIPAATITAYVAAHPLVTTSLTIELAQINAQYWLTTGTLFDFNEAWTNWRRSGFPVLTPVNYAGNFTTGTIPRRQEYPSGEAATNGSNYQAAVNRLTGGDQYSSRVWWDK
ncbi:SusD/RagB family nutrient-binding outer membrane lipoprotein [Puia dinghuensis]|uniref:SusD/RagB family nutrient-binding outer membrane lipoprotein n=1 Tax=Puia dinghuensis TaxID=1792502 RepID=A0A8J2UA18_9BACT|nr:SusD/RagB family nutrient-binding outer membrane lipoprotein [Puia dinghuensis]GGA89753.1 hypothetical protein GCM10011511_11240 [Puia dinghuensis]